MLNHFTSLCVGGRPLAMIFAQNVGDVRRAEKVGRVLMLGGGTNVLVADEGVPDVVVKLEGPEFMRLTSIGGDRYEVGAGVLLSRIAALGAGALTGIPGTLGGALVGNAGTAGGNIGEMVEAVFLLGGTRRGVDCAFDYRRSNLETEMILGAVLKLKKTEKADRVDFPARSAGCVFRNPRGEHTAGLLLDAAGCKGLTEGRAHVWMKHANVIETVWGVQASDVAGLMREMVERVRRQTGITLEPEIKLWGF